MNRRELIKRFGFCSMLAAVPIAIVEDDRRPIAFPTYGLPYVIAFVATGLAERQATAGRCGIKRRSETLIEFHINEMGGMVQWDPGPDVLFVRRREDVDVYTSSPLIVANALIVTDRSLVVMHSDGTVEPA